MPFGKKWAGKIYGTNTGNIFLKLTGADDALSGTLRINDATYGFANYNVDCVFDGETLSITGKPEVSTTSDGVSFGQLSASGRLNSKGDIEGDWETDTGPAGTFLLFPHDRESEKSETELSPPQLFTARHNFGAIEIDIEDAMRIGEEIQKEFLSAEVVITIDSGTQQSFFLKDLKKLSLPSGQITFLKLYAREAERSGINRVVTVELGSSVNFVAVESSDEAWALGKTETLKQRIARHQKSYTTTFKRFGVTLNQLLLVGVIAFLPSLQEFSERIFLVSVAMALLAGVDLFHTRYLPLSIIHLDPKKPGLISRIGPSLLSWLSTITAGLTTALLGAYLAGLLNLPVLAN